MQAHVLTRLFPNSKFVYMIRDGHAHVYLSAKSMHVNVNIVFNYSQSELQF